MNIKVPPLAEGVTTGTVVNILVKEGDKVKKGQDLFELETEKAVAAIPAMEAGTVTKIHAKPGDKVSVGQVILTMSEDGAEGGSISRLAQGEVKSDVRPRVAAVPTQTAQQISAAPAPAGDYTYQSKSGFPPPASPEIRRMARELGIDLARVQGSERGGRITMNDLRAYIASLQQAAFAPRPVQGATAPTSASAAPAPSIDFSKWGPVERKPMSSLRMKISGRMVESWTTIPHVTQFDEADMTAILDLRAKYVAAYEKRKAYLTVTSFVLKALVTVLKKHPIFNSSLDEAAREIVTKNYYHFGIAVDTEQGLIVPVLRDVDKKSILELSIELPEIAEKTRQRKISIADLQGSSFTISNQGGIGGAHFTPIINKPELAILGIGRAAMKPVVRNKKIEPRRMMPLALSYDHRIIDGANAARFVKDLVEELENFKEDGLKIHNDPMKAKKGAGKKKK